MRNCEVEKRLKLIRADFFKRTRPTLLKLSARDKEALHEVRHLIESQPTSQPLSLKQLCRKTGLNEYKLKKGFKEYFGWTPYDYHLEIKMNEAKKLLLNTDTSVCTVAYQVGYQHVPNFCMQFKKRFGITARCFQIQVEENTSEINPDQNARIVDKDLLIERVHTRECDLKLSEK